jgi:GNAT superfamily N-acetyltransferase
LTQLKKKRGWRSALLSQASLQNASTARFTLEILKEAMIEPKERGLTEMKLREIEPQDAGQVSLLVTQLGYQRTPAQVGLWIAQSDARRQMAFVATSEAEIIGWIEVELIHHLQSAPFVLIGGLVVKDGVRGLGVGRSLCEQAESWARGRGVETVRVTSRSTRTDAHRFYLRDGYQLNKTSLVFEKEIGEKLP